MALYANYPIAMAPGMGLNAYFAYVVVGSMGFTWQAALGAVFISGCIFLILTVLFVVLLIALPMVKKPAAAGGGGGGH